ncbi:MAG: alpha-amylase family glycosyl hydrolase [Actinomycetota bacterium]|nr:alpha-amylase family glycosyl hydrolase [Actinomycetota bacterium]
MTEPVAAEPPLTDAELDERVADRRTEAAAALAVLYPGRGEELADELMRRACAAARERRPALVALDRARQRRPDWFLEPDRVGYIAYADRFGGTLEGVTSRIPYLRELGVNVLHLMSVLRAREGENDGGYAIDDYREPDPALGSTADLRRLGDHLRDHGISLCLDLVMNHTSDHHAWAIAARQGSAYHRRLYRTFGDRTVPDAYEATLPEVFPEMAPGNFTRCEELGAWVWTTFREFQWDLDWSNPDVLLEMVDVLCHLADLGVDIVRLDAVAFTWRRLGTNSQNQPEAHLIAQVLRSVVGVAAPATLLLAEAIVGPDDLVGYLGRHERARRECDLAYHNQLMVQGWSMVAERRAELATVALRRLPAPPSDTTWLTYVRCHDDIGWAVADEDAAALGLDGPRHREFLAAFYRGDFPGSFGRGTPFSTNDRTGDERTCGMTATLCGITAGEAAHDPAARDLGVARLPLLYGLAFGFGGIPMIYMGDELAQGDLDDGAERHPGRPGHPATVRDTRWLHRPWFDAHAAATRHDPTTVSGAVWHGMRRLVEARRNCPPLHGSGTVELLAPGHPSVLAWRRVHERFGTVVGLANASELGVDVDRALVDELGPGTVDLLDPDAGPDPDGLAYVPPLRVRWLTADRCFRAVPVP